MLQHPGIELQLLIKEKGLTQKAFASILGKKVSEINELLKGKRNITIQRDYSLHQALGTPIKYRILKQIDYEYSIIIPDQIENNHSENTFKNKNKESKEISDLDNKSTNITPEENNTSNNKLSEEQIEKQRKINEDFKNRARIFRSF